MCERDADAIRHFRRPVPGQFQLPALVGLAHALERQGRLPEAREAGERAIELARDAQMRSWALGATGYTHALLGDRDRANAYAEEAVAARRRASTRASSRSPPTRSPRRSSSRSAARSARSSWRGSTPAKLDAGRRAMLLVVRAYAELALGRTANATENLARAAALVEKLPLAVPRSMVRNAQARFLLEAGDFTAAAATAAVDSPFPLYAADARLIRGRALACAADLTAAQEAVPGVVRLHDEAAHALRRLGQAAPGRQRRFARGELSGREREIADLVAEGLSNREIAGAAVPLREDRRGPPDEHLRQARRAQAGAGGRASRQRGRLAGPRQLSGLTAGRPAWDPRPPVKVVLVVVLAVALALPASASAATISLSVDRAPTLKISLNGSTRVVVSRVGSNVYVQGSARGRVRRSACTAGQRASTTAAPACTRITFIGSTGSDEFAGLARPHVPVTADGLGGDDEISGARGQRHAHRRQRRRHPARRRRQRHRSTAATAPT